MNKITVVVPVKKARVLSRLLREQGIKRFIKLKEKDYYKFEIIITELKTQELLSLIKKELNLKPGISTGEGYLTVHHTDLIAPVISEKGKVRELKELTMIDAKKFVKLDRNYFILSLCAGMIASIGLQLDNIVVLIGSMLISPLMAPVMAVSYGMSKSNKSLILNGLKSELLGISLIVLVSLLMSFLPNPSLELEETLAKGNLFLILLLAVVIGVVAANSFITGSYNTLIGVAVGISLLPPLTNFVLLIMKNSFIYALDSLFSFLFNIFGMHLSALATFLVINYLDQKNKKINV